MGGTLIQPSATSWSTFRSLPVSREAAAVGVSDLARHHAADRLRQLALANRLDTSCRLPSLLPGQILCSYSEIAGDDQVDPHAMTTPVLAIS